MPSAARRKLFRRATATSGCGIGTHFRALGGRGARAALQDEQLGRQIRLPDDATVGDEIARLAGARIRAFDFVLEGGAIDHDGEGTILTTRQTLLTEPQRLDEEEAERALREALGGKRLSGSTRASRTITPTAISTTSRASSRRAVSSVSRQPARTTPTPRRWRPSRGRSKRRRMRGAAASMSCASREPGCTAMRLARLLRPRI